MPTYSLILNGLLVEVYLSPEEDWRFDDVLIWDMMGDLIIREETLIMQYLFDEGFIKDRRTQCHVTKAT